jgi:hypothetical protein
MYAPGQQQGTGQPGKVLPDQHHKEEIGAAQVAVEKTSQY